MAYNIHHPLTDKYLSARHLDVTVATASGYAVVAGAGSLIGVKTVIEGAITTDDEVLNVYLNAADTGYDITIATASSAAGDEDSVDIPEGAVTVSENDVLTLVSANASGGTTAAAVTYIIRES